MDVCAYKLEPSMQVVKALIMNELHESGELPEIATRCEELLSSALETRQLQETIDEVAGTQRIVVQQDDHITVLDSRIGEQWQRFAILTVPSACMRCHHHSTSVLCLGVYNLKGRIPSKLNGTKNISVSRFILYLL